MSNQSENSSKISKGSRSSRFARKDSVDRIAEDMVELKKSMADIVRAFSRLNIPERELTTESNSAIGPLGSGMKDGERASVDLVMSFDEDLNDETAEKVKK